MSTPSKTKPVLIGAIALAVVAVLGYQLPATPVQGGARVLLPNKGGAVLFGHAAHQQTHKVACETCHHTGVAEDGSAPACGSCHAAEFNEEWIASHTEAFADPSSCGSCHHTAYVGLNFDHDRHVAEYAGEDCQACHHGTDIWPEPAACSSCHGPEDKGPVVSLEKANHEVCGRCHADWYGDGLTQCSTCHVQAKDPAEADNGLAACSTCHTEEPEALVPTRTNAFHGQCMGCHEQAGGPAGQDCFRCHTS